MIVDWIWGPWLRTRLAARICCPRREGPLPLQVDRWLAEGVQGGVATDGDGMALHPRSRCRQARGHVTPPEKIRIRGTGSPPVWIPRTIAISWPLALPHKSRLSQSQGGDGFSFVLAAEQLHRLSSA